MTGKNFYKVNKNNIFLLLKIVVSFIAIFWFVTSVHWDDYFEKLRQVNWPLIVIAVILNAIFILPVAIRWKIIADECGYPLSFFDSVRGYFIGSFFNTFLPTGKGGDFARGGLIAHNKNYSLGGLLGTIFIERILGFIVTIVLLLLACIVWFSRVELLKNTLYSILLLIVFVFCILLIAVPLFRIIFRKIENSPFNRMQKFADDIKRVLELSHRNSRIIIYAGSVTVLNQILRILLAMLLAKAIPGFGAPWYSFIIVTLLIFIAVLLPSVGGYGIRESGYIAFFGWFAVDTQAAAVFSILILLLIWFNALIGVFVFITFRKKQNVLGASLRAAVLTGILKQK
ncbi:flippase-like domain-containing protein [candidate division KSB1 bacterium]|nr:flippase-like domain-containing protein [candidate division KSB1 bacterium]